MASIPKHLFHSIGPNSDLRWMKLRQANRQRFKRQLQARDALFDRMLALIKKRGPEFFRGGNHPTNADDLQLNYNCYHRYLRLLLQKHPHLYQLREQGRALPWRTRTIGVWRTPMTAARIRRGWLTPTRAGSRLPKAPPADSPT